MLAAKVPRPDPWSAGGGSDFVLCHIRLHLGHFPALGSVAVAAGSSWLGPIRPHTRFSCLLPAFSALTGPVLAKLPFADDSGGGAFFNLKHALAESRELRLLVI
jgi:hypothetical protein